MATDIKIENSTFADTPYPEEKRTALGRRLAEAGDAAAIREAYLYVPDLKKRSEWRGPHHELKGGPRETRRVARSSPSGRA